MALAVQRGMAERHRTFLLQFTLGQQRTAKLGIGAVAGLCDAAIDPRAHRTRRQEGRGQARALAQLGFLAQRDEAVILQQPHRAHQPRRRRKLHPRQPVGPAVPDISLIDLRRRILGQHDLGGQVIGRAAGDMDDLYRLGDRIAVQPQRPATPQRLPTQRMVAVVDLGQLDRAEIAGAFIQHTVHEQQPRAAQVEEAIRPRDRHYPLALRRPAKRVDIGPAPSFLTGRGEFQHLHHQFLPKLCLGRIWKAALMPPPRHSPHAPVRARVRGRPSARCGHRPAHAPGRAAHSRAAAGNG